MPVPRSVSIPQLPPTHLPTPPPKKSGIIPIQYVITSASFYISEHKICRKNGLKSKFSLSAACYIIDN